MCGYTIQYTKPMITTNDKWYTDIQILFQLFLKSEFPRTHKNYSWVVGRTAGKNIDFV